MNRRNFLTRLTAAFAGVTAAISLPKKANAAQIDSPKGRMSFNKGLELVLPDTGVRCTANGELPKGVEGEMYYDGRTGKIYRYFGKWIHVATAL